ncbi:cysteine synthase A [Planctomycetota bacterium]
MKIAECITDLIGNTPLLDLKRLAANAPARVLAKCDMFNPISIKDRAVFSMLTKAEERGDIRSGDTLIEATSGNTGMALAYIGAIKGYRVILCMSEIQSIERRKVLKALGAELHLTPVAEGTRGAKEKALALHEQLENSYYLGQHHNMDNRRAHIETTGLEIWEDTDGEVDIFVAAMGTCGTICGVSEVIKTRKPSFKVVGVEPEEAPFLSQGKWRPHEMMGTAPGFRPKIYDPEMIDEVVCVSVADAFEMCRQIAQKEGLLVGISSGATANASLQIANRPENNGKLIVCMFADSGERYLSVDKLFDQ